ncbi:MAG: aminotransferase class V-fold PLP-dependent enzyme [Candidatus Heimdallarchaeaceae archaeon]
MSITTSRFGQEFLIEPGTLYLDSATIGRMPKLALDQMIKYMQECNGYHRGSTHKLGICTSRALHEARVRTAEFFKVKTPQVSFLPSFESGLINVIFSRRWDKEDRILTSTVEEHSILASVIRGKKAFGYNIDYLSLNDEIDLIGSITEKLTQNTKMLIFSALTVAIGTKRDWRKIAEISKEHDVIFVLDISRVVGHEPLYFNKVMPEVILSTGSVGALGPAGTAFQILSPEFAEEFDPILVGSSSVESIQKESYKLAPPSLMFEPGTLNFPGIVALAKSLEILQEIGLDNIYKNEQTLVEKLDKGLNELSSIQRITVDGAEKGPIFSIFSEKIEAYDIAIILEDLSNIVVRAGSLCSHLLMDELKLANVVQISTHLYNTQEEIEKLLENLNMIVSEI